MKKAITILAALIVLVGAVFAETQTETHSIQLHTTVEKVEPIFHLVYVSSDGTAATGATIATGEKATNSSNVKFTDGAERDYASALEIGDISKGAITVVFKVTLSNPAKLVQAYDLALDATGFAVTHNTTPATTAITSKTLSGFAAHNGVNVIQKVANSTATATFTGKTCDESTVLANYQVVYTQDTEADPTNAGATYTSDVTLTITTSV